MWNANTLDYSGSQQGKTMVSEMWNTFPSYRKQLN